MRSLLAAPGPTTLVLFVLVVFSCPGQDPKDRMWSPVRDKVYLQEIGTQIKTARAVEAVIAKDNVVYAAMGGELYSLTGEALQPVVDAPKSISRLRVAAGQIWLAAADGSYLLDKGKWRRVSDQPMVDFCAHLGAVYAATRHELFRFQDGSFVSVRPREGYLSTDTTVIMEDYSQVLSDPVEIGPISRIASYSGTLYLLGNGKVSLLEGRTLVPNPIDWGTLVTPGTDMLAMGSRLFIATGKGLAVLRGMALTTQTGLQGLPVEDLTCLASGFEGDLWIGTRRGAVRKCGEDFHFFGADRWLPGNVVLDIAVAGRTVYIATEAGLALIHYEPFTLARKAAWFERELQDWGFKRMGFVHKLYWSDGRNAWEREISDNDGGNTAMYLAAMSYKYAATGQQPARMDALESFKAMLWLDEITPKPGFIARAIWSEQGDGGERSKSGSGGLPAKWYKTPDGAWWWKGDTSSDEVNAHIYAVSLFHRLAAQGDEKARAARHIQNIASHIMENGWVLRDMDGKPTRWGRWDPDYLLKPYGFEARGLNGMEAQTYMHVAHALTGDDRFSKGLTQLLQWRYHTYTVRQRLTFPPEQVVPWDDELAFYCYEPLLHYTTDPELRSIYLRSLERTWEVLRIQQLPFYNFVYGVATGNDCEAEQAVQHLREWSLDLVNHNFRNSHRADLSTRSGYVPYSGGTRAISPRESESRWGARNTLDYDGGEGGRAVTPPIGWLMDYWMGRFYGFIEAPSADDVHLTQLPPRLKKVTGAPPYAGPPGPN